MRFFEISSGHRIPVSLEEQDLLDRAGADRHLMQSDLSEREGVMALRMVSRGLLNEQTDDEGRTYFVPNDTADLWRY